MSGQIQMRTLILISACFGCYAPPHAPAATDAINEIALTRMAGGFGNGPAYTVTLRSDGTASYEGVVNVPMLGRYRADMDAEAFRALAEHAIRIGFWALEDEYFSEYTDLTSTVTAVVAGKRRKRLLNYGSAAPREVREFEAAIDAVAARLRWNAVDG
ncbi:MAG TPA: DUF6438 domain-containing protein [Gemmatimonadales bacterium]|nr:DUF6438 domain-containing protein [Gemmatimonadales bacterium]